MSFNRPDCFTEGDNLRCEACDYLIEVLYNSLATARL